MLKVPKLSAPLVKDIRTGEGIAEWAVGAAVVVLTAVGDLGVVKGSTLLTVLAAVKGARRTVLKVVAQLKPVVGTPIYPAWSTTSANVPAMVQTVQSAPPAPPAA